MGRFRGLAFVPLTLVIGLIATAALAGCGPDLAGGGSSQETVRPTTPTTPTAPTSEAPTTPTTGPQTGTEATMVSVIDGDTIVTSEGTVRIIGIDSPERGECGYGAAVAVVERLLSPGDRVELIAAPRVDDRDKYDRLLRFVEVDGIDVGFAVLQSGNAVARYDSRDGYPVHPREKKYHDAQTAQLIGGDVITVDCAGSSNTVAPNTSPSVPGAATTGGEWWLQYRSCSQLKKNTVGHPKGPFNRNDPSQAAIYDWFANGTGNNGDGDGDGFACEGW